MPAFEYRGPSFSLSLRMTFGFCAMDMTPAGPPDCACWKRGASSGSLCTSRMSEQTVGEVCA